MCEYLNYEVQTLKRTRIMNIKLDVPVGNYRELTPSELKNLNELLSESTKVYKSNSTRFSSNRKKHND